MKFSTSIASLLVLAPFIFQQAAAAPPQFGGGGGQFGAGRGGNNAGKGGNNGAGGAAAAAAAKGGNNAAGKGAAASSSAAGAAASSSAAAAQGGAGGDLQSSLTLDPSVIAKGFENDGQSQPEAGQVASKTSSNNFINFCATVPQLPITNGQQITTGSCNPAPMGIIAATTNMPSCKFQFPTNGANIPANQAFTIKMAIKNLDTGNFVNAQENYFSAPQFTGSSGNVQGHSHVVIEQLDSMTQTTPTDPTKFAFFKGLNDAAQGGVLTADVTSGLPAGTYRMASINSAANHQPVLVAVAQHGSLDDMVYFTVGGAGGNNGAAAAGNATAGAGAAAASASAAAAAKGGKGGNAAAGKGAAGNNGAAAAAAQGGKGGNAAAGKGAAGNNGAAAAAAAAKGGKGKKGKRFLREY